MGKTTGTATDVFLCLFGVFAALFAVAPQQPFGFPARPVIELEWNASQEIQCMFKLVVVVDGTKVDLPIPDTTYAGFSDGKCRWSTILDGVNTAASSRRALLLTPFRDECVTIRFGAEDSQELCRATPGPAEPATIEVDFSDGS
ncbi:MAG: hypothetical protein ABJ375_01865 [Rhizobiaceae bacterium]